MRHILWASKALVQLSMRRFYQEHPAPRVGGGPHPFALMITTNPRITPLVIEARWEMNF